MGKGAVRSVNIYVNNKEAIRSMDELKKRIEAETRAWQKMAKGTREYYAKAAEISRMQDALNKENELIKSVTERRQKSLMQVGMVGSALSGLVQTVQMLNQGLQKVRDLAADMAGLDDAMGRVRKTTNLSRQEVSELNEEFTKIDTRTSREELNELAYAAGKLGVQGEKDVLAFVKAADVINVALGDVLGGTDAIIEVTKLAQVFKGTTKEIEQSGLEETLIRTGSVINELGKTSTANESQIAKFLGRIASYASIAGMSLDQMAGIGSVLSQNSKAPEMSATALTKIMQQMIKKTGSFAEMIGMNADELSDLMAKDFNAALLKVLQKLHDIGDVQSIVPIFKDLGADATRASQVILALSTNIDKVREAQETANKAIKEGTSMNKEYEVMNETYQAQMEKAKKIVFDARVELGEKLYPYIIKYTFFGGKVIKWIAKLTEHGENAFMALAAAAAVAANKIVKNWSGLKDRISQLPAVIEWNEMKTAQKEISESKERQNTLQKEYNLLHKVSEERSEKILAKEKEIHVQTQQRVAIIKEMEASEKSTDAARQAAAARMKTDLGEEVALKTQLQEQETLLAELTRERELTTKKIAAAKKDTSVAAAAAEEARLLEQQESIQKRINTVENQRKATETALAVKQKERLATLQQIAAAGGEQGELAKKLLLNEEELTQLEKEKLALSKEQEATLARENATEKAITLEKKKQETMTKTTTALSILKNHWMLILTVVIEVGLMIAKIVKEQNKFRKELNKTYEDTVKNTQAERMEAEWLFASLERANTAEEERLRIMKQLNEKYGDYLRNLTDEEGRILNIEAAHRAVIDAIIAENNAKGFSKAKEQLGEKYGEDMQGNLSSMYDLLKNSKVNGKKITDNILSEIWKNVNDMIGKNFREDQIKAYLHDSGVDFGEKWGGGQSGAVVENEGLFFSQYTLYVKAKKNYDRDLSEQQRLYNMELETSEEKLQRLTNMYIKLRQQYENASNDAEKANRKKEMDAYLNDIATAFEDKMLQGQDLYKMGWSDLALLEEYIKKQMKAIEGTTAWSKKLEGAQRALKRVQDQMKKVKSGGNGPTTTDLPDDEDYDPDNPSASGSGKGKSPADKWEDILKRIKELNDKYDIKDTPISNAKQQVIADFMKMEAEAEAFAKKFPEYAGKAAKEIEALETEKWHQIERIETEERKKQLERIEENLASVTEKLNKFQLKQRRKHQTQLETDLEEIENDWAKLRKKTEEERDKLQDRRDAANIVSTMFDISDSEVSGSIMNHYKKLLAKFGITAESWASAMKLKPKNAQDLLTLLGLDFSDEDQRTLDAIIQKIDDLDTAKIKEIQSLASDRAREIVTELSDTATRQYREAMKTIEDQIKTLEAAMQYLQAHNDGGEYDQRIQEIEKTLAFLKGQKGNIQQKYENGFEKFSLAALFDISEQDWAEWSKNWQDNLEKMTSSLKDFADNVFELWSAIDNVLKNQEEAELARMEKTYDQKSENLKKQLDNGIISQKRYDAQMEQLQKEKEEKEKKIKHKQFERQRAASIVQAAINGALAVTSIWAEWGAQPIVAAVLTALAATTNGLEIAAIASEPNPYAHGGYIEKKQYAVMGEEGPEWVASNKLLRDKETKPIIEALNEYQHGDTKALERITMPAPSLKNVSQAMPANGRNFAASNTTNNFYQKEDNGKVLEILERMEDYIKDPNNRRAYISRNIQLEFDEREREVREMARL